MKALDLRYLTLIMLFSCGGDKQLQSDEMLIKQIQKQARSGEAILNLTDLTDFQWDRLLILTPYTQVDSIEKYLSTDLSKIKPSKIEFSDHINQLIFFSKGLAVKMIEYPRYPGNFDNEQHRIEFIRREEATFDIIITDEKTSDGKDWIEFKKR
jgi:hypothetical protein